jgi:GTP-binding protein Era
MIDTISRRCGLIAILGAPNVGKSTLVNALVGSKVSIVSHKVQTTRRRILGIALHHHSQLVLIDTPGIFNPRKPFEHAMVEAAWDSIQDVDCVIVMADASSPSQTMTQHILQQLQLQRSYRLPQLQDRVIPFILVLNKIDCINREQLLPLTQTYVTAFPDISQVFMISAKTKSGVADLLNYLSVQVPEGPWLFPEDHLTDLPLRLWAAELTREKVYRFLHQELPYAIHVETEKWEHFANGDIKIMQTIHVERENQKAIVLGKGGQMLKRLGEITRHELQKALETRVHLLLNVRVTPDWKKDPYYYVTQGLEPPVFKKAVQPSRASSQKTKSPINKTKSPKK